jgi:hypothetical protein
LVSFLPSASSVLEDSSGILGKIQAVLRGEDVQEFPASINNYNKHTFIRVGNMELILKVSLPHRI